MMVELFSLFRWIHELAAIAWFGEVFFITHIIVPMLGKLPNSEKGPLMMKLFPRVFRMATVSSAITIIAGVGTALVEANFDGSVFLGTKWGLLILAGGLIGLFMFLLHMTVEQVELRALSRITLNSQGELAPELATLYSRLRILPRIGFTLLTIAIVLMIYASHGF
jgi:uncharacterized membrane protein